MMMSTFRLAVLQVVRGIPRGQVKTYKQVAEEAGYPRAYRAVGSVMKQNFDPHIPCHRVIRSSGRAGRYNRGDLEKIRRLRAEGVIIDL